VRGTSFIHVGGYEEKGKGTRVLTAELFLIEKGGRNLVEVFSENDCTTLPRMIEGWGKREAKREVPRGIRGKEL